MRHVVCASLLLFACGSKPPPAATDVPFAAIAAAVDASNPDLVALRRDLHSHPELSLAESRTAGVVGDALSARGL